MLMGAGGGEGEGGGGLGGGGGEGEGGGGDGAIVSHVPSTTSTPSVTVHAEASAVGLQYWQVLYVFPLFVLGWTKRNFPAAQQMSSIKQWVVPTADPGVHSVLLVAESHT
jgi:hypothetical protein